MASLTGTVFVPDVIGTRLLPFLEPRRSIAVGMALWAVGPFVTAVAPNVEVMTAARIGQGFGLALQAAAAPLTGGAVAAIGTGTLGPRPAFAVCGALAALCALAAWLTLPTLPSSTRPRFGLPRLPWMMRPRALLALVIGATGQGTRGALA